MGNGAAPPPGAGPGEIAPGTVLFGEYEILGEAEIAEIAEELLRTRGPIGRVWALAEMEAAELG